MIQTNFIVQNKVGLHARPASLLVKAASAFQSEIMISKGDNEVNAKSILSLLTLGAGKGDEIIICVDGIDEKEAIRKILNTLENFED